MSDDLFGKHFVPVQHMGNQGSPFQKYSSAHVSAAQESLLPGHELYPCNSPAHLSSPFSSSEVFYTNTFVPIDVKSDQVSKDSSAYDNHPDYAQHELSAETASSLDGVHFAQGDEQDAERKNKKKVGRPIAYKGDPNAPNLTEAERRCVKRRIANRESARRVRARRQETLEELQVRMNHINAYNAEMVKHIADVEGHTALLKGQLQQTELHWNRAVADNARLHQQMAVLSAKLKDQPAVEKVDQKSAEKVLLNTCTLVRAGSAAPGTGISCSLIDELPTMALPMTEMMTGPGWEGFDQEFSDYLM